MASEMIPARAAAGVRDAGRYLFHEAACESRPAQMWFQQSHEGLILFIVFYTKACRWGRCAGCALSSKVSPGHVPCKALMEQVDYVFRCRQVLARQQLIRKVIISNNGSIFDQKTFAKRALQYLFVQLARNLPNVTTLTLESRPEYVRQAELEFVSRVLSRIGSRMRVEIAVGFEAFDDHIRNNVYNKGLSLAAFERFMERVAPFGYRVKCYVMYKPAPDMTEREAVTDVHRAMDYLARIAGRYDVEINVHINPTYVAAGTMLEEAFRDGRYQPPMLGDVADAIRYARGKLFSVFVGLTDEGLAVEHGSFIREGDEAILSRLDEFNRTQDFDVLDTNGARSSDQLLGEPGSARISCPLRACTLTIRAQPVG